MLACDGTGLRTKRAYMINRIFVVTDSILHGTDIPVMDNIYLALMVNPDDTDQLTTLYPFIETNQELSVSLVLRIRQEILPQTASLITSFLFLPSYTYINQKPVIHFLIDSPDVAFNADEVLVSYLESQGINEVLTTKIFPGKEVILSGGYKLFEPREGLIEHYREVLEDTDQSERPVFVKVNSDSDIRPVLLSLQEVEEDFKRRLPAMYTLLHRNRARENEIDRIKRKLALTEAELNNQKQYVETLKAGHATKELQEYYDNEYESLPVWYKRFGHAIKVIMGKRTFRSLFNDNVKKYKS